MQERSGEHGERGANQHTVNPTPPTSPSRRVWESSSQVKINFGCLDAEKNILEKSWSEPSIWFCSEAGRGRRIWAGSGVAGLQTTSQHYFGCLNERFGAMGYSGVWRLPIGNKHRRAVFTKKNHGCQVEKTTIFIPAPSPVRE